MQFDESNKVRQLSLNIWPHTKFEAMQKAVYTYVESGYHAECARYANICVPGNSEFIGGSSLLCPPCPCYTTHCDPPPSENTDHANWRLEPLPGTTRPMRTKAPGPWARFRLHRQNRKVAGTARGAYEHKLGPTLPIEFPSTMM